MKGNKAFFIVLLIFVGACTHVPQVSHMPVKPTPALPILVDEVKDQPSEIKKTAIVSTIEMGDFIVATDDHFYRAFNTFRDEGFVDIWRPKLSFPIRLMNDDGPIKIKKIVKRDTLEAYELSQSLSRQKM